MRSQIQKSWPECQLHTPLLLPLPDPRKYARIHVQLYQAWLRMAASWNNHAKTKWKVLKGFNFYLEFIGPFAELSKRVHSIRWLEAKLLRFRKRGSKFSHTIGTVPITLKIVNTCHFSKRFYLGNFENFRQNFSEIVLGLAFDTLEFHIILLLCRWSFRRRFQIISPRSPNWTVF